MKIPKLRFPTSSLAILVKNPALSGYFVAIMRNPIPRIKHMLIIFDPKMLPSETPIVCGSMIANMATKSSGNEVEKATSRNPTFVFPNPVMLAKLTELVIVRLLDLIKTINEIIRTMTFPIIPNCSITFSGTS